MKRRALVCALVTVGVAAHAASAHDEPAVHGVFRFVGAEWRLVAGGTSYAWHDHRIHWDRKTPPPAVAAAPDQPHKLFDWRIPGRAGGRRFVITGFLGYAPAPAVSHGRSWWPVPLAAFGALALALGAVRGRRRRGSATRAGGGPLSD